MRFFDKIISMLIPTRWVKYSFSKYVDNLTEKQLKKLLGWLLIKLSVLMIENRKECESISILYEKREKKTKVEVTYDIKVLE